MMQFNNLLQGIKNGQKNTSQNCAKLTFTQSAALQAKGALTKYY